MNNIKAIILIMTGILAGCGHNFCSAANKSDNLKPKWVTQALPESKAGTYIFVRSHGEGGSLAGAKQMAFVAMTQRLEIERGLTVNTAVEATEFLYQDQRSSGNIQMQEITLEATEKGRKLEIVCREIDDYWVETRGKYEVDILYTVTDKNSFGGSYNDDITVTAKYPAAGFLSIIPSVGQFYKGSIAKGSMILAGTVAAAGGIVVCENTRASYVKKMQEQPKHAAEYNSLADSWETGRNVCIGAAAAVYIYNLIDAFTATGAKHIVVKRSRIVYSALPYADSQSVGVSLALNF
jgi:hypothetical protein